MVKQVEDEPKGGGLGDAQFDIDKNRRTLGQMKDGWRRLDALPNNSNEQRELSKDLGLVVDSANRGRPLVDKMLLNTILHVPVERLHADAIVSCAYPELRASAGFFKGTHYYATMPSPPFLSCTCCGVVLAGEAILIFALWRQMIPGANVSVTSTAMISTKTFCFLPNFPGHNNQHANLLVGAPLD